MLLGEDCPDSKGLQGKPTETASFQACPSYSSFLFTQDLMTTEESSVTLVKDPRGQSSEEKCRANGFCVLGKRRLLCDLMMVPKHR